MVDMDKLPASIPEVPGDTPILRQRTIEGNLRPWNGVDYSEFTEEQKRKIRHYYAASVLQIDYEVGQILQSLRDNELMDNTVVIFASDHGDYLGDHNLIGKSTFYESSTRVPLIVRPAGGGTKEVHREVVGLGDVTATMLAYGGCTLPQWLDSIPLPTLGLAGDGVREVFFGMVGEGWMALDGRWKLCKYDTGEHLLFDLASDPTEQNNLIASPLAQEVRQRLDEALSTEIMRSITLANADRRVYKMDRSGDVVFGREGWRRAYPQSLD